ncbi:unnamed protein product [Allacma fusca]|uniref:Uncharacterized protein n=1 Tax=Allacma fusca TaxID=39272 RepID=A0A8J2K4N6_9HEXA|nr:unnamed protein product [Allacma fusca]
MNELQSIQHSFQQQQGIRTSSYCPLHVIQNQDKMNNLRITLTALVLLNCTYKYWCLIKHCDPDTDEKREKMLEAGDYGNLKKYLQADTTTNGRIGFIMFANWQDQLLHIEAPKHILGDCLWKMKPEGKNDKEANEFNDKGYVGKHLYAGALMKNFYLRTISCETDHCVQYYNVVSRPITKPDFPVQVYVTYDVDVYCNLDLMDTHSRDLFKPPFQFIWTGPKDCKEENWDTASCKKYVHSPIDEDKCASHAGCDVQVETTGPYKKTKIRITGKTIGGEKSQIKSVLQIKDAAMEHNGKWRCIVVDANGVSSDPGLKDHKSFEDQGIIHRGTIQIHVKTIWFAIGVPLAIICGVIIMSLLCILLCKQCTDFDVTPDQDPAEGAIENDLPRVENTKTVKSLAVTAAPTVAPGGLATASIANVKPGNE